MKAPVWVSSTVFQSAVMNYKTAVMRLHANKVCAVKCKSIIVTLIHTVEMLRYWGFASDAHRGIKLETQGKVLISMSLITNTTNRWAQSFCGDLLLCKTCSLFPHYLPSTCSCHTSREQVCVYDNVCIMCGTFWCGFRSRSLYWGGSLFATGSDDNGFLFQSYMRWCTCCWQETYVYSIDTGYVYVCVCERILKNISPYSVIEVLNVCYTNVCSRCSSS